MKHIILALLLLSACSAPILEDVGVAKAKDLLETEPGLFVLNVHTPYEGELEGTDTIIEDWENIADHTDQLPADKNTPILIYCRSGRMSSSSATQLQELGYNTIYNLAGGMKAWKAEGNTLLNSTLP